MTDTSPKPRANQQVLQEFRNKLRIAEDLIAKLSYNLREIRGFQKNDRMKKEKRNTAQKTLAPVIRFAGLLPEGRF